MAEPANAPEPRVGRSSIILAAGTILSRILGFAKTALLAATIGATTTAGDAFWTANQLPNTLYSLTVGGILTAVLVPQIVQAMRGPDAGASYINKIATLALIVFTSATALLTIASPLLVLVFAPGWDSHQLALATAFAYWCVPQLFFYGVYALLGGILNARKIFGPYTWAPVVNNVIAIAGLVLYLVIFGADPRGTQALTDWSSWQIAVLAGTSTLGVIGQAVTLLFYWRTTSLHYRPDFVFRHVGLGATITAAGWILGTVVLTQLQFLINTRVVNLAAPARAAGDLSIVGINGYEIAALIYMLPHSVAAVSIATVYFTRFSDHASDKNDRSFIADFSNGARHIGVITVFSTFGLAVLSFPIARFFTPLDMGAIRGLALVMLVLLPSLVAMSISFLATRGLYAYNNTRTPFLIAASRLAWCLPAYWAVSTLEAHWITVGAGVVMSLLMFYECTLTLRTLRKRVGGIDGHRILQTHVRLVVAAVPAAIIGLVAAWWLGAYSITGFALETKFNAVIAIGLVGVVMASTYFVGLRMLRVAELSDFTAIVSKRFGRGR